MNPSIGTTPRRRWMVAIAGLSAALLGPSACATSPAAGSGPVGLAVIDRDTGQRLHVHVKDAQGYVAGTPGSKYALRLTNHSGGRMLVVLSVDGINVVSGETAGWNQVGYVLDPWRSHDIVGWRKSDTQVAAFEFAALRDSYAAQTGRPGHVGVIGMAVFAEKAPEPVTAPPAVHGGVERSADMPAARAAANSGVAELSKERLGTGHGEREWSVSRRTSFERATTRPQFRAEIWYDSRENLIAAGVIPTRWAEHRRAFPRSDPEPGYVPDPPRR
jgi:hypothetical protein